MRTLARVILTIIITLLWALSIYLITLGTLQPYAAVLSFFVGGFVGGVLALIWHDDDDGIY